MANKRQRKKRMKKLAQMKVVKQATIIPLTFREIEDMRVKEQTDLHNAKENERLERTAPYQEALNKKYGGSVMVKDKFINPRATLLHRCSRCLKEFYANPVWILTKEDQKHVCGVDPVRMGDITFKSKRKVTDKDIVKMQELERQGMNVSKIAIEIGVSRPTVIKYLKKSEESRVLI